MLQQTTHFQVFSSTINWSQCLMTNALSNHAYNTLNVYLLSSSRNDDTSKNDDTSENAQKNRQHLCIRVTMFPSDRLWLIWPARWCPRWPPATYIDITVTASTLRSVPFFCLAEPHASDMPNNTESHGKYALACMMHQSGRHRQMRSTIYK